MKNEKKQFYSTNETAKLLGLSDRTILRYIKSGELKAFKIGNKWRISRSSIDEFIGERESNQ